MNVKLLIGLGAAVLLSACASSPQPDAALITARAAVQSAEADPNVSKFAALDLESARKELATAEAAALNHKDAQVDQPAYLAAQTARLAQARAAGKADDARVAAGQVERDRIQLAARTREVGTAEAQAAAAAAQTARLQTEIDALKATPTDRGLVLTLGDVLFDTGKAELNSGAGTARQFREVGAVDPRHRLLAHQHRGVRQGVSRRQQHRLRRSPDESPG